MADEALTSDGHDRDSLRFDLERGVNAMFEKHCEPYKLALIEAIQILSKPNVKIEHPAEIGSLITRLQALLKDRPYPVEMLIQPTAVGLHWLIDGDQSEIASVKLDNGKFLFAVLGTHSFACERAAGKWVKVDLPSWLDADLGVHRE